MEDAGFVFGEAPVQARVHSGRATPEEIQAIADTIWRAVEAANIAPSDNKGNDALLKRLQGEFGDFARSFPLVLRWMAQLRKYNRNAFRLYLLKHASTDVSKREEFLALQAEYLVFLYREEHPHPDENHVRQYRLRLVQQLLDEDTAFAAIRKEVEAQLAAEASADGAERRVALRNHLIASRVAQEKKV